MPASTALRFQPRLIPTLAMLVLLAVFLYLGQWQYRKGERRAAELAQHAARAGLGPVEVGSTPMDAQALLDAPVRVRGRYDADQQFYIDNRQHQGQPGVHVVTPLRIDGGATRILVNRGWIGWGGSRLRLPDAPVPTGEVELVGVTALPSQKGFLLMPERQEFPQLWPRLDLQRYAQSHDHPVQPLVLLLQQQQLPAERPPVLVRDWPPSPDRVAMHRGYAFQWFGMALALLVFYGVASTRRLKR